MTGSFLWSFSFFLQYHTPLDCRPVFPHCPTPENNYFFYSRGCLTLLCTFYYKFKYSTNAVYMLLSWIVFVGYHLCYRMLCAFCVKNKMRKEEKEEKIILTQSITQVFLSRPPRKYPQSTFSKEKEFF